MFKKKKGGEESTVVVNDNSLVYDELHLIWKVDKSRQQGQRQKKLLSRQF